jgi:hypothetical protein
MGARLDTSTNRGRPTANCAVSGFLVTRPMVANTQENAYPNASTRTSAAAAAAGPAWNRNPAAVPTRDQQRDGHRVAGQVSQGAAGQYGRTGHRQRPEPVDDALAEILRQADHGGVAAEQRGLCEDAGDEVVDVAAAPDGDGPAEDVAEQQHEDHRPEAREREQLRGAHDAAGSAG